jgi:hypothetical protein
MQIIQRNKWVNRIFLFALVLAAMSGKLVTSAIEEFSVCRQEKTDPQVLLKLEFSTSSSQVEALLLYNSCLIPGLEVSVHRDFIFILCYTVLFIFSWLVLRQYQEKLFPSMALLIFVSLPGICDIIENLFLLKFLKSNGTIDVPMLYIVAVRLKWVLSVLLSGAVILAILDVARNAIRNAFRQIFKVKSF